MSLAARSSADWIDSVAAALADSERILIGAGAGLSAAAGIDYTDTATFARLFPKWAQRGYRMQYEFVGFQEWTEAQKWAYWATHVNHVFYQFPPSALYRRLHALVQGKNFYVITSNADGLFIKSGFEPQRVFEAQGNYERLKCTRSCTGQTWDTKPFIDRVLAHIDPETFQVADPMALPVCPHCGAPLFVAFRAWEGYRQKAADYERWLEGTIAEKLLVMEIGVGFNTPGVIRWPFERLVHLHNRVLFARVNCAYRHYANTAHPQIPHEIRSKSVSINADALAVIDALFSFSQTAHVPWPPADRR